jgi:hypothetical protein
VKLSVLTYTLLSRGAYQRLRFSARYSEISPSTSDSVMPRSLALSGPRSTNVSQDFSSVYRRPASSMTSEGRRFSARAVSSNKLRRENFLGVNYGALFILALRGRQDLIGKPGVATLCL